MTILSLLLIPIIHELGHFIVALFFSFVKFKFGFGNLFPWIWFTDSSIMETKDYIPSWIYF